MIFSSLVLFSSWVLFSSLVLGAQEASHQEGEGTPRLVSSEVFSFFFFVFVGCQATTVSCPAHNDCVVSCTKKLLGTNIFLGVSVCGLLRTQFSKKAKKNKHLGTNMHGHIRHVAISIQIRWNKLKRWHCILRTATSKRWQRCQIGIRLKHKKIMSNRINSKKNRHKRE